MTKEINHMFTMSRLLVVAGKGGVGKTTVTAVLARASADAGLRVLVVTLDSRPGLAELLGGSPSDGADYVGTMIHTHLGVTETGSIQMRTVTAGEALQDYLATQGLALLAKRLVSSGVVGVVASAAPGIDDLLVLGKLKHLVGLTGPDGDHDLIIVDGPAAGHAISFLQAPAAMAQTISGGPLRSQAIEVRSMLQDPKKCRVVMVTTPETTPVNELIETTERLAQSVGVAFAPVIVNGIDISLEISSLVASGEIPDGVLGDAMRYRSTRSDVHLQAIARVHEHMAVGSFALPHITTASLQAHDVVALADIMRKAVGETA